MQTESAATTTTTTTLRTWDAVRYFGSLVAEHGSLWVVQGQHVASNGRAMVELSDHNGRRMVCGADSVELAPERAPASDVELDMLAEVYTAADRTALGVAILSGKFERPAPVQLAMLPAADSTVAATGLLF